MRSLYIVAVLAASVSAAPLPVHHDVPHHNYSDYYPRDVEFHHGEQLQRDIEHEYDELFHDIAAQTRHGIEHHDVESAEMHHGYDYPFADWHEPTHHADHHDDHHDAHVDHHVDFHMDHHVVNDHPVSHHGDAHHVVDHHHSGQWHLEEPLHFDGIEQQSNREPHSPYDRAMLEEAYAQPHTTQHYGGYLPYDSRWGAHQYGGHLGNEVQENREPHSPYDRAMLEEAYAQPHSTQHYGGYLPYDSRWGAHQYGGHYGNEAESNDRHPIVFGQHNFDDGHFGYGYGHGAGYTDYDSHDSHMGLHRDWRFGTPHHSEGHYYGEHLDNEVASNHRQPFAFGTHNFDDGHWGYGYDHSDQYTDYDALDSHQGLHRDWRFGAQHHADPHFYDAHDPYGAAVSAHGEYYPYSHYPAPHPADSFHHSAPHHGVPHQRSLHHDDFHQSPHHDDFYQSPHHPAVGSYDAYSPLYHSDLSGYATDSWMPHGPFGADHYSAPHGAFDADYWMPHGDGDFPMVDGYGYGHAGFGDGPDAYDQFGYGSPTLSEYGYDIGYGYDHDQYDHAPVGHPDIHPEVTAQEHHSEHDAVLHMSKLHSASKLHLSDQTSPWMDGYY